MRGDYTRIYYLNGVNIFVENQEIFIQLILENVNRKEKSLISTNEYDFLRNYEMNLIQLIERCPVNKLNQILTEIDGKPQPQKEDEKNNNNNEPK